MRLERQDPTVAILYGFPGAGGGDGTGLRDGEESGEKSEPGTSFTRESNGHQRISTRPREWCKSLGTSTPA